MTNNRVTYQDQSANHPRPPNLSSAYNYCSNNGEICRTGLGTTSVAYAADDGNIYYRTGTLSGVPCNNEHFGISSNKITGTCWSMPVPNSIRIPPSGNPPGFIYCANEGGTCNVPGYKMGHILYGADGQYNYANATSVACNDSIMGKPNTTSPKSCYYKLYNPNVADPPSHNPRLPSTNPSAQPPKSQNWRKTVLDSRIYKEINKLSRNQTFIMLLVFFVALCIITVAFSVTKPYH